uniref:52 kDa repressor of the inhibitor of the protein kinase-like n=1 Tax=Phallusia mammillata TaxID=59560 RepID=A0A6F9DQ96_9ASCI|nr:52 kDa repressor of the inhibitor of the protein kinase-like [Phallusia mammillata]
MDRGRKIQAANNRAVLSSVLETVILCGRQNIALRGHADSGPVSDPTQQSTTVNEGNFRSLLRFRVSSGDNVLKNHLETCAKNAMYTSSVIQNELISTCGTLIRTELV